MLYYIKHYFFLTKPEGKLESIDSFFCGFESVFEESDGLSSFLSGEEVSARELSLTDEPLEEWLSFSEPEPETESKELPSYHASGTVISSLEEPEFVVSELPDVSEEFDDFMGFLTEECELSVLLGFEIS